MGLISAFGAVAMNCQKANCCRPYLVAAMTARLA
jgi:hypothetical protein